MTCNMATENIFCLDVLKTRCSAAAIFLEGCAPLVRAFQAGEDGAVPWEKPETRVWGLRVPRSLADTLILEALRSTRGAAVSVGETDLKEIQSRFARQEGRWLGPEGAAAVAGFERLYDEGRIGEGERALIFQTGHPANYLERYDD